MNYKKHYLKAVKQNEEKRYEEPDLFENSVPKKNGKSFLDVLGCLGVGIGLVIGLVVLAFVVFVVVSVVQQGGWG